MAESAYAAIDLGAESGRIVLGRIDRGRASLDVVHRFANRPVRLPDGLHWNLPELFSEALTGLRGAAAKASLRGIGIDTWGVDYALLDSRFRMLGLPFHYRDGRTDGMIERANTRVPREELYSVTGIQTMPINTCFQLLADEDSDALPNAEHIGLVPDLLAYWLTGELANEVTAASTTGLLDARTGDWARPIIDRLGIPAGLFSGSPVESATTLGPVLADHEEAVGGAVGVPVHATAGHDTAAAFAAAPLRASNSAVLSSGTWSLLGVELDEPMLTPQAAGYNLTNERGVDGTIRLLRNVMGLWLIQECRRHWEGHRERISYDELNALAARVEGEPPLFDPDDDRFLAPGDMPARIAEACEATDQPPPSSPGETVRSILLSLACKYRLVLERLERVTQREIGVVHVIGGGARNRLLCELTAELLGRPVLAGPVEATALGNVLVQARACGQLGSLAAIREVSAGSVSPVTYEPGGDRGKADGTYRRFMELTGLAANDQEPAPA